MTDYIVVDRAGNETLVKKVMASCSENGLLCFHCSKGIEYFNIDTVLSATIKIEDDKNS